MMKWMVIGLVLIPALGWGQKKKFPRHTVKETYVIADGKEFLVSKDINTTFPDGNPDTYAQMYLQYNLSDTGSVFQSMYVAQYRNETAYDLECHADTLGRPILMAVNHSLVSPDHRNGKDITYDRYPGRQFPYELDVGYEIGNTSVGQTFGLDSLAVSKFYTRVALRQLAYTDSVFSLEFPNLEQKFLYKSRRDTVDTLLAGVTKHIMKDSVHHQNGQWEVKHDSSFIRFKTFRGKKYTSTTHEYGTDRNLSSLLNYSYLLTPNDDYDIVEQVSFRLDKETGDTISVVRKEWQNDTVRHEEFQLERIIYRGATPHDTLNNFRSVVHRTKYGNPISFYLSADLPNGRIRQAGKISQNGRIKYTKDNHRTVDYYSSLLSEIGVGHRPLTLKQAKKGYKIIHRQKRKAKRRRHSRRRIKRRNIPYNAKGFKVVSRDRKNKVVVKERVQDDYRERFVLQY